MSAPPVDRLEAGPVRRLRPDVARRLVRALLAGLVAWLLLGVLSVVTATGWRPPEPVAPPEVAEHWLARLLQLDWRKVEPAGFAAAHIARTLNDLRQQLTETA